jgi:nucleoid DNA-binding protein
MVKPVKNTAPAKAAAKPEAAKGGKKSPAKAPVKAPAKKGPKKVEAATKPEAEAEELEAGETEVEATGSLGRHELAVAIRAKVAETGAALPEKLAEAAVKGFEQVVEEAVSKGQEINLPGFGKFAVTLKPARTGRNPKTGEAVEIETRYAVKFKPGKALKDAANSRPAS